MYNRAAIIAIILLAGSLMLLPYSYSSGSDGDLDPAQGSLPKGITTPSERDMILDQMDWSGSHHLVENRGQIENIEILFYSDGGEIYFGEGQIWIKLSKREYIENEDQLSTFGLRDKGPPEFGERGVVIRYSFVNSNKVIPKGSDRCSWNSNFFHGDDESKWQTDVPNYRKVIYEDLWDGVDLVYGIKEDHMKYDLIVHPGGDPDDIRIKVDGCDDLKIGDNGDLLIETEMGSVKDSNLLTFYKNDKKSIGSNFIINDANIFSFDIDEYDGMETVVIDPQLEYSTFIGGNGQERGMDIALDGDKNAYITGYTTSSDFPTTPGAYDRTFGGGHYYNSDVFVFKMNPDSSSLLFSTFLGGKDDDWGNGIVVDGGGNVYVTGWTENSSTPFPTTDGSFDTTHNGVNDSFVCKLNNDGNSLVYSTFIGGEKLDFSNDIEVDLDGNVYITGHTNSAMHFPTTEGANDTTHNGGNFDAFACKIDPNGSSLIYSTFLGGFHWDMGFGIALDTDDNLFVTGFTMSMDFPTTAHVFDRSFNGGEDVFVSKINKDGSELLFSTYIGGSLSDEGNEIVTDQWSCPYIIGYTGSQSFPTTEGANDTEINGTDVFVCKMDSYGSDLIYSTFIGGNGSEAGLDIELDKNGNVYSTGNSFSDDFPITPGAYNRERKGISNSFIFKLNRNGSDLIYSTLIGGRWSDHGEGITIDENGRIYITGFTNSEDFPTTEDAFDTSYNCDEYYAYDIFSCTVHIELPSRPESLSAEYIDGNITLSWDPPLETYGFPITNYKIYRGPEALNLTWHDTIGDITQYSDTAGEPFRNYYYRVSAISTEGEGQLSDSAKYEPPILGAPENLNSTVGPGYVKLTWDPPINTHGEPIEKYKIYRNKIPMNKSLLTNVSTLYYNDTTTSFNHTYCYSVSAVNLFGEGNISEEIQVDTYHLPTMPLNIEASLGFRNVTLNWDPPDDDGGDPHITYNIYRGTSENDLELKVREHPFPYYFEEDLTDGQSYYYEVSAVNSVGEGPRSKVMITPYSFPSKPLSFEIEVGDGYAYLKWEPPSYNGGDPYLKYRVYYGTQIDSPDYMETLTETSFKSTRLTNGKTYFFRVAAVNTMGQGPYSEVLNATPYGKPSIPIDFTLESGDRYIRLDWNRPMDDGGYEDLGYNIYRGITESTIEFYKYTEETNLSDTGLTNGVTYFYAITAVNPLREGMSTDIRYTTPYGLPSEPISFKLEPGDGHIILKWAPPEDNGGDPELSYRVYRGLSSGDFKLIDTTTDIFFNDTGLTNGIKYLYRISAVNILGEGPITDTLYETLYSTPGAPIMKDPKTGEGFIFLYWNAPSYLGGYESSYESLTYTIYRGITLDNMSIIVSGLKAQVYNDTDVQNGINYIYMVSATNSVGEGPLSNITSASSLSFGDDENREDDQDLMKLLFAILIFASIILFISLLYILMIRKRTHLGEE